VSAPSLVSLAHSRFPHCVFPITSRPGTPIWRIEPTGFAEVCAWLRDEPQARFDLLLVLTCVDGDLRYLLASPAQHTRIEVRVRPARERSLDSVAGVWPAANWAEREVYELWGIRFSGRLALDPLYDARDTSLDACVRSGTRFPTSLDGLCIRAILNGDRIVRAQPEPGLRRCGIEARLASAPYGQGALFAARMDGWAAMHADLAYARAVEHLLELAIPPRARYLRTIYAELQRINSHLCWLARAAARLADPLFVAPAYASRARQGVLDLFEWLGGNAVTPDLIAVGGLRRDAPDDLPACLERLMDELERWLDDLDALLASSHWDTWLRDLGVIDPGTALGLGMTGPCLRASGIAYDVRKTFPYAAYDHLDFDTHTEQGGDALARCRVRLRDARTSIGLVRTAARQLPGGPINAIAPGGIGRPTAVPPVPAGSAYAAVESPRGELGVYVVSDGSTHPRHVAVRGPSLHHLSASPLMMRDVTLEQAEWILDSLDISPGEAER